MFLVQDRDASTARPRSSKRQGAEKKKEKKREKERHPLPSFYKPFATRDPRSLVQSRSLCSNSSDC